MVCALDPWSSHAVTSLDPPRSLILDGPSSSRSVGADSSSRIVSVKASGLPATPCRLFATPDMFTVRSGASTLLSTARTDTLPVLAVARAGMVSKLPIWRKSRCSAGATGST